METYLGPLLWVAEKYRQHNPFFVYGGKNPLLHQTELVAKSLFIRPTRILVADVIGLGKTITALRILKLLDRYNRLRRVLIAVPSVLVDQWVDEMRGMGIRYTLIERRILDFLDKHPELPSGWYVGSIDTLKYAEYMEMLERSRWDAIVVDEAHKLGIVGNEPNMRWQSLGKLIRENRDAVVLLLSATPHRGKADDYLARLSLIDPTLLEVATINNLDKIFDRPEFYQRTHNVILFRRSKEEVNNLYQETEVFKPCSMLAVLVEPNEVEKELIGIVTDLATSYLGGFYTRMIEELGLKTGSAQGIVALLRTVLVKRGLSSPMALVETFRKVVEKRGRFMELLEMGYSPEKAEEIIAQELSNEVRGLDEILTGDIGEVKEELDGRFGRLASYLDVFLDEELLKKLEKAKNHAEAIITGKEPDSKVETLKRILRLVLGISSERLPEEYSDLASGKAIVFTEFKDTAKYLYGRLKRWAEEELGDPSVIRVFTSENKGEIEKIKKWLSESEKAVLVTTDVAGEGLNLQYANVLINYEIAWSPIRLEQRIGRVWRYGQNKTTYVFNLFLAHELEKEVAEVVFSKLYGISISVGKLEPILGERVFLSTIRNELLEHAVESDEVIGGFIPIEIKLKERKISLSEAKIIEMVLKDSKGFVESFINALRKLVRELRLKRIFPAAANAEGIRREMRHLAGFEDDEDVFSSLRKIVDILSDHLNLEKREEEEVIILRSKNGKVYDFPMSDPEGFLRRLGDYFRTKEFSKYFVFQSDKKEVLVLTEAEVRIGGETRYSEPIGLVADLGTNEIKILRGRELIERLAKILKSSIPVDEIYGLDDVLGVIPQIVSASYNTFYERELRDGAVKLIGLLRDYETLKKELGGLQFFHISDPELGIRNPRFIMISSAFLPEVGELPSEEVWGWAEDEAMPIVFNYEGLNRREAVRVSGYEHYDVRSVRRDEEGSILEERFIEVKTKMRPSLSVGLKDEEFRVAREKGDSYWLYVVYGVRTEKPVILCLRNPLKKLHYWRKVAYELREEYVLGIKGPGK